MTFSLYDFDSTTFADLLDAHPSPATPLYFDSPATHDGFLYSYPDTPAPDIDPLHLKTTSAPDTNTDNTADLFDFEYTNDIAYPTPAESVLDNFSTSPDIAQPYPDFDSLFADLYDCTASTPDTLAAPIEHFDQTEHTSYESLFGDLPLYQNTDALYPDVPQSALFPVLPKHEPVADSTVTLSYVQLAALLQAASNPTTISPSEVAPAPAKPIVRVSRPARRSIKDTSSTKPRRKTQIYTCPHKDCGKEFTRHFNLKSHLPLHDPERPRPFSCHACEKSFFKQNDLARHEQTHTGETERACSCGKRYSRVDALKRHVKQTGCIVDIAAAAS
ncbi:hypothetical protein HKX48_005220 [Thoreauomyces humboldtii]|nr:hypothetical protein HKX48_005220 [Thoreauomyces humboldtii]